MANPEHVKLLLSGKEAVNDWQEEFRGTMKTAGGHRDLDLNDWLKDRGAMKTTSCHLDLRDASLEGIKLVNYDLTWADLRNAKLSKAELGLTTLLEADLRNADLSEAYLSETDCTGADFRRTQLYCISATKTEFAGADMREACLLNADLSDSSFTHANLEWANLMGATLLRTNFRHANLANAKLSAIGFGTDAIEGWNITNAKCYYYYMVDYELRRKELREIRRLNQSEFKKKKGLIAVGSPFAGYTRIPEKGYLKGNEFEDLFKARQTIEFLFIHGMKVLDPAILGAAIDLANSEHPSKGFRLLSIDAKGGVPRAVIEIADKVSKEDALQLVHTYYQQTITQMNRELEGLTKDKGSLLHILSGKTLLSAIEPLKLEGKQPKVKPIGRPKEHSDDKIKAAETLFNELQDEGKAVNECWFEVHKKLSFKSPEAAKQAVYRFNKQNKKQK